MVHEAATDDVVFVLDMKDGKYSVKDDTGRRRSKWMTPGELNRAIRRSTTVVIVAEAVGEKADPILKMVARQQFV